MKLKLTMTALAAAMLAAGTLPAHAQTAKDFDDMRQEIKRLRDEVEALKKDKAAAAKPADTTGWGDRIEALEIKQKDAVVLGDIGGGGGFRLPGSETSIRFYGYAEGDVIHDFRGTSAPDIFTYLPNQPLNSTNPPHGQTKLTAETSRFGFESSTPTAYGPFTTKLEGDFYSFSDDSSRNHLRLRHAYGEYDGFLIGQTWGTFMDVDDLPETVDFNGPIGSPFVRKTMIRYTYKDPTIANFTVALEDDGQTGARLPDLVGKVDRSFDWGAANVRFMTHEKRDAASGIHKRGYGWGFGGSLKATDKDLLMMQFARVDGDFDNQYGSNGYVENNALDTTVPATGFAFDRNYGLIVGWTHTQNDNWRGTVAYGMNRSVASDEFKLLVAGSDGINNKTLEQLHLNVIYTPIKNVDLGAEYIYGRRITYDDQLGTMSRFSLMGRYTF
jgi:DcaP outer membrane protein